MTAATHTPREAAPRSAHPAPPPLSQQEALEDLLDQSGRGIVPIRKTFLQIGRGKKTKPGPLADFVSSHAICLRVVHDYETPPSFAGARDVPITATLSATRGSERWILGRGASGLDGAQDAERPIASPAHREPPTSGRFGRASRLRPPGRRRFGASTARCPLESACTSAGLQVALCLPAVGLQLDCACGSSSEAERG